MKKALIFIFLIFIIKSYGQCSFSVIASYTAPTCSTCCNGIIQASIQGVPCLNPVTLTLQPLGITNATSTYSNLCAGSYTVVGWDGCCMPTCFVPLVYSPTNVLEKDNSPLTINLFPNPTSKTLFISGKQNELEDSEINIINYLGQIILKTKFKPELDVSELSNGVYILQITNSKSQTVSKRLVIAK